MQSGNFEGEKKGYYLQELEITQQHPGRTLRSQVERERTSARECTHRGQGFSAAESADLGVCELTPY